MSEVPDAHEQEPVRVLRLPVSQRSQIESWAAEEYPREACGLLLGRARARVTEIVEVRRARNANVDAPGARFDLDPRDQLAAEDEARERGLEVVGVWHSHPDHPPHPSARDRERAWSGWSYVIVSIDARKGRELRSWRLAGERFEQEAVQP